MASYDMLHTPDRTVRIIRSICQVLSCFVRIVLGAVFSQGMQQLLDESASDSRDIRYKFLALGDMLKRRQASCTPVQFNCCDPKSSAGHSKVTHPHSHRIQTGAIKEKLKISQ